jgi:diacylglycerol kinase
MIQPSDMKNPGKFSFSQRLRSFRFAFSGLKVLLENEHNFRIHLFILVLVIAAGIIFQISAADWIAITVVSALVLTAECFNSAIEYLCDIVSPGLHPLVGKIKDITAAAVLISAIAAAITGLIIFIPEIEDIFEKLTGN